MDPDSCVNCLVEDCHIDVGDDGVSIKAYDVRGVGPAPSVNVTVRRTNVVSRNICVGGATEGGVRNILFEDVQVGSPDVVTSPWAIKFKVDTGSLRNITFRRLRLGRIGDTPWMYPANAPGDAFHIDIVGKASTEAWFSKCYNRSNESYTPDADCDDADRLFYASTDASTASPPTMEGLTFEDISVVAVKSVGHIAGPAGSLIKNLTLRNITVDNKPAAWGACRNVDLSSLVVDGVSPPLVCT